MEQSAEPGGESPPTKPEAAAEANAEESRLRLTIDLPRGEHLRVTVDRLPDADGLAAPLGEIVIQPGGELEATAGLGAATVQTEPESGAPAAKDRHIDWSRLALRLPIWLFALSLLVYLVTRLVGLSSFPIYFFTDEAVQTMLAADLVRDNLHGGDGVLLPTYFQNGSYYNLGTSVYLQVLPNLLFGRSVFVTRLVSVLVSVLAAAAVGLMLRDFYKIPYWWSGTLLLSISPAWFLHSRTAFETVVFVSFYAGMLYAYLLYRLRSPRYLYLTLILAALAFYAYSAGQVIIAATGLLLLLSDLRYHWQNRRILLKGALLAALLALPYLRFRLEHPEAAYHQLRMLDSYLLQPLPLAEKFERFRSEYLYALSPAYWFTPNERDLPRHLMKGYAHLLRFSLPFALIGLLLAFRRIRQTEYRLLLSALLAVPLGGAVVMVGITRVLALVIPAAILTALGIAWVLAWLENPSACLQGWGVRRLPPWLERWKLPQALLSLSLFAILAAANFAMLADALRSGPLWYRDYGMGGMQYGARQGFAAAQEYLARRPQAKIIFSSTWANGADVLARFFMGDPLPLEIGSIQGHLIRRLPLDENTLFVVTPEEYQTILDSEKLTGVQVERILPFPDGSPGFYFIRLRYVDNIDEIFASEQEQRRVLQSEMVDIDGETVPVRYSALDMGDISLAFDGDDFTLMRSFEANPLVIELDFPQLRRMSGFSIITGSAAVEIRATVAQAGEAAPGEYSTQHTGSVEQPQASLDFGENMLVEQLRIEVLDANQQEPAHVHVWEIEFDNALGE
jgi:hypothetical protein